eukprot:scaffold26078_cov36-Phaeocystis_antarctica.AAC.2
MPTKPLCSVHLKGRSLAVDLAEDNVLRADDGDDVGEHVPLRHHVQPLQVREAGRADVALVRLVAAIGHEVDAELALGRLDGRVRLTGRRRVALREELEVVDEGLHVLLHLAAGGGRDLAVVHAHRARLEQVEAPGGRGEQR